MNIGIKVTKDGQDISTQPDSYENIKKFSLISSVNVAGAGFTLLKAKTQAKVTLSNGASTTIAHGLAYKPIFWVFVSDGTIVKPVYYDTSSTYAYIDSTNLVIANFEGGSRDFYYYIFYDAL